MTRWIAPILIVSSACIAAPGGTTSLGTLSLQSAPAFESLGQTVSGQACSRVLSNDDYRKAALQAIARVKGANALGDAKLEIRQKFGGTFCMRVRGVAGVLR